MNELLRISGALYDETRITILAFLIRYGKSCVCELATSLNLGQSRLSRHLGILYDAGFLTMDRKGKWVHYAINNNSNEPLNVILKEIKKQNLPLAKKIDACNIKQGKTNEKCSNSMHG